MYSDTEDYRGTLHLKQMVAHGTYPWFSFRILKELHVCNLTNYIRHTKGKYQETKHLTPVTFFTVPCAQLYKQMTYNSPTIKNTETNMAPINGYLVLLWSSHIKSRAIDYTILLHNTRYSIGVGYSWTHSDMELKPLATSLKKIVKNIRIKICHPTHNSCFKVPFNLNVFNSKIVLRSKLSKSMCFTVGYNQRNTVNKTRDSHSPYNRDTKKGQLQYVTILKNTLPWNQLERFRLWLFPVKTF